MTNVMGTASKFGLENHGLTDLKSVFWTLPRAPLIEQIILRREARFAEGGAVVANTGEYTGRAAKDKFIVNSGSEAEKVDWGKVNKPISAEHFDALHARMCEYFKGREVFVQDTSAGWHPKYRMPIRVVTDQAWHNLFTRNMFVTLPISALRDHEPKFTILHAPEFTADPKQDGTHSSVFIIISFERRMVLIGGTAYAGEIKKSIFTVLNHLLPQQGVLGMHCSANVGKDGDAALFFGLSGTGKTTLSSDPERFIVGDDEHGWGDDGVFNFEGGSYAKAIRLREKYEPLIYQATRRFGTILENVVIDPVTHEVDYDDDTLTENTRASYPLDFLPNTLEKARCGHPNHVFFLTADAFGVLPPIAKLTPEQALYYFLSGYTAKLAGTERGLGDEPQATFSACFGAPFLPLHPRVYADLLGEKISRHNSQVWLVNTGWTGGPFGVGERINLPYTRAMVSAAMNGALQDVPTQPDPVFGLHVPESVPDVPDAVLNPRGTWHDGAAYDDAARKLVARFRENFEQYASDVSEQILAAGP